jgi:hypothetical protein
MSLSNDRFPVGFEFDSLGWFDEDGGGPFTTGQVLRYAEGDPAIAARWHLCSTRYSLADYLKRPPDQQRATRTSPSV